LRGCLVRAPIVAAAAVAVALSGCGAARDAGDKIPGKTLTIYSSLPLHGAGSADAEAIVNGEEMALAQTGARIGRYRIVLRELDDSTAARAEWDPGQTTVNARLAVQDRTAIGYLGELNSGASAISIPLLNRAGIAQISPASTAVGLTAALPGAAPGEPQKYYPTGKRTFARVIPNDSAQAAAQARLQKDLGCTSTYVLDDGEFDGEDMASAFSYAAVAAGIRVPAVQAFDPLATDYSALAITVAQSGVNCIMISAIDGAAAALLTRQLAAAAPRALLFASDALAQAAYINPARGGIPTPLDNRVMLTVATLAASAYPAAGRAFLRSYAALYGPPQPDAIYGYEAMSLLLNAIARATDGGKKTARRSSVVRALFATRDRDSVLGVYSIDSNGDTTLRRYGLWRVAGGRLRFVAVSSI